MPFIKKHVSISSRFNFMTLTLAVSKVLMPASYLNLDFRFHDICRTCTNAREFDVLYRLLLGQHPFLPFGRTVCHGSQDDLGNLESRFSEPHCTS